MDYYFIENLRKKERTCRYYQSQAATALANNKNVPCADQCRYLQLAADLEADMASITLGEERAHHIREKQRLDYEIAKVNGVICKTNNKDNNTNDANASANNDKEKKSKDEQELDRMARGWYKDAPKHSFDDVAGMSDLKVKLNGCIRDAKSEALLDFLQIPRLNSYFFVGPPGCGKTYIIEAFAHELLEQDYKYMVLQGSDIISRYVGDAEKIVTRLFEEAEKNAPCIIFIDEIDSVCKNRSLPNLPEYAANITTSFLTGYNRIHSSDSKIIFIGATNYPGRVDNAMLDRVETVYVNLPDAEAREAAFTKQLGAIVQLDEDITFEYMAQQSENYNYRDIERFTTALKRFIFDDIMNPDTEDAVAPTQEEAIEQLRSGDYKLTKAMFDGVMGTFTPAAKEDILKGIDNWKKEHHIQE